MLANELVGREGLGPSTDVVGRDRVDDMLPKLVAALTVEAADRLPLLMVRFMRSTGPLIQCLVVR